MLLDAVAGRGRLARVRLLLASGSPRRRELLERLGVALEVLPSGFSEDLEHARFGSAADYVAETALRKALHVVLALEAERGPARQTNGEGAQGGAGGAAWPDAVVAADTVVVLDGEILEKPRDAAHARSTLRRLSGRSHSVITCYSLVLPAAGPDGAARTGTIGGGDGPTASLLEAARRSVMVLQGRAETRVTFAELSDAEIAAYVETGEPMDKAGSYGIQALGGLFVERIDGCFYNVMGLPLHRFAADFAQLARAPELSWLWDAVAARGSA